MSEIPKTLVKLGPEDAERMRRLTEEVQGRLEELAQIAATALGRNLEGDDVRKFVPAPRAKRREAEAATDDSTVLIEITGESSGTATCTIFCPPPASEVFVERPCGSTGFQCP
jgi:hypothetical protein